MQEEYTNDKNLCEWLRANSSGIYRLTGFAADKIEQLKEELETMRASNRIKQANIELLEAENETLEDKLQEQLSTVGSLLEENAKLIAVRDELIHDRDMLKMCADHYEDELKRMHAERDDVLGRKPADELAENGDMYADVYCQIVDMIEPYVKRGFNDSGELPASVVNSFEIIFKFWLEYKAERDKRQKIPDCKFGDNIVWFLREFENAEKEYLEEGCLEIYGEDANGKEGSCEITVNEICREAANAIEKLLAEREQWMKQEPIRWMSPTIKNHTISNASKLMEGSEHVFNSYCIKLYGKPYIEDNDIESVISKKPWRINIDAAGDYFISAADNAHIADVNSEYDAKLIVNAVNNFYPASHQLPAQQIPEGLIEWLRNFEKMTYNSGFLWMAKDVRKFIGLLSASQPKGDV